MKRTPEQIDDRISVISASWKMNPDLRLGQLLTNSLPMGSVLYYVEDAGLMFHLGELVSETKIGKFKEDL